MMERASARTVWWHAREIVRPVRGRYLGAFAAVVASTLITLSGPALVRYALDAGIKKHALHPLNVAALIFLGLALLKPFAVRAQILLAATAGERFLGALRTAAFEKLQALPLGFFEQERAGVLVSRLTSDVQSLTEFVRDALVEVAGSALQITLTVAALLILSPKLAAKGYCVFTLNYGATDSGLPDIAKNIGVYGLGPIADSAKQLSAFVDKVLAKTGAART